MTAAAQPFRTDGPGAGSPAMRDVPGYLAEVDRMVRSGPYAPSFASFTDYPVPRWYQDSKFGIFIHWGPYAAAAFGNEWYAHAMYRRGSKEFERHLARHGSHVTHGYKDLIPQLTGARFDAGAWADLFQRAGARFVVPVAEHHDGFAMYDCSFTRWKATAMGPRRDVLGELARATRERGMTFGCSSHRAEHYWFFGHGLELPSDVQDPAFADLYGPVVPPPKDHSSRTETTPPAGFLDDWLARSCELVERYSPQLLWFDWWIQHAAFKPYLQRFAAFYYNWADRQGLPVAINSKYDAFVEGTTVFDIERGQLKAIAPRFWQNDTSVARNSWGYTEAQDYKQARDLIHDLVDVVAKNGALLLNVGPRADGTIPEPEQELLLEIGRWLAVHGEAIYGTRPWMVFGEGPTAVPEGAFSDTKREAFTARDIRFTTKDDALYATVLAWPTDGKVLVRSLGSELALHPEPIARVELVGHGPVAWERREDGLAVTLPERRTSEHALVVKIAR
jgi:alpha-L-fucosidase